MPEPRAKRSLPETGCLVLDGDGRVRALDGPARRALAPILAEPLGAALADLLGGEFAAAIVRAREGPAPLAVGLELGGLALEAMLVPLPDRELLVRLADRSGSEAEAEKLAQARRLQALGQMAAVLAHDVANLLGGIGLATDALAARVGPGPEIADIRAAIAHGSALTSGLLAFGRQQRLRPRLVDVNKAIGRLAPLLERLLGARAQLILALPRGVGRARVDPAQLQQVLCNLTVNAREAMPEGGTLTVRTGRVAMFRPLSLGVEMVAPGEYAMIELADSGVGIAPSVQARMFEPFFTTRAERGGTGLGLATVHGVVRQSGGFLGLDSAPGRGTRMRVYLPRIGPRTGPRTGRGRAELAAGGA